MLAMSQSRDPGPLADEFGGSALRCGRILERSSSVCHFLFTGHLFVEITVISIGEDNFFIHQATSLIPGVAVVLDTLSNQYVQPERGPVAPDLLSWFVCQPAHVTQHVVLLSFLCLKIRLTMSNSFHLGFVVSNKRYGLECQCWLGREGITSNLHSTCIDDCRIPRRIDVLHMKSPYWWPMECYTGIIFVFKVYIPLSPFRSCIVERSK